MPSLPVSGGLLLSAAGVRKYNHWNNSRLWRRKRVYWRLLSLFSIISLPRLNLMLFFRAVWKKERKRKTADVVKSDWFGTFGPQLCGEWVIGKPGVRSWSPTHSRWALEKRISWLKKNKNHHFLSGSSVSLEFVSKSLNRSDYYYFLQRRLVVIVTEFHHTCMHNETQQNASLMCTQLLNIVRER